MVTIDNVSVEFHGTQRLLRAVNGVSLSIREGDVFGIVGTSGAGKSTLLRTINLLQKPTFGRVVIDSVDITCYSGIDLRRVRQKIGMIFQQFNLIHTKTVFDNVAFPMRIAGKPQTEIAKRVLYLLELVGLLDKIYAYPSKLSGGQKQRVGIARALANDPRILLCDEPASALDLETTNAILDLLKGIHRKLGITMLLISHEMSVIKKVCTRVAVMSEGVVVEEGNVYNIFASPQHSLTQSLVAHSLDLELPERVLGSAKGALVKAVYKGIKAEEPVLSDAIREFGVGINVLHGKIEYINDQPLGVLILNITGNEQGVGQTIEYLRTRTASVEVIHG
ncbi:MAG: methionine ABC transporter ATP-binding protein [Candidatus Omnitrophica bacterium]|nr:methionine ABC transporter ATP-binding protein [Candidatus Omnitrophota bacterium]